MSLLDCPSCQGHLRVVVEGRVEIDVCDRCDSVWLDPGELNVIAQPADSELGQPLMTLRTESDLGCPRCETFDFCDVAFDAASVSRCNGCGGVYVSVDALDRLSDGIAHVQVDAAAKFTPPTEPTDSADEAPCQPGPVTQFAVDTVGGGIVELLISAIFHI